MTDEMTAADRVDGIRGRISAACARVGRDPDSVRLVAVSKTHDPDAVRDVHAAGVSVFGESRVQEALQKQALCPSGLEWHMIGHLQRNKVRPVVAMFSMIHSIDSLRLLEAVDGASAEHGKVMPVCLEVNVSGERSKCGFAPDDALAALESSGGLMNVDICGLMTIPPFLAEADDVRPFFVRLRELRDDWSARTGIPLEHLSMGMSHDFEIAIEEGATMVRVGTALFGTRKKPRRDVGQPPDDVIAS